MKRRDFLKVGLAVAGGALVSESLTAGTRQRPTHGPRFRLNYAPHFGTFRHLAGNGLLDQLRFAADQGFTAWEDRIIKSRPIDLQNRIARTMDALALRMGVFTASERFGDVTRTPLDGNATQFVLRDIRSSVDVARRVNARWMTINMECFGDSVEQEIRRVACEDLLKRCAEILEPHGLIMAIEMSNSQNVRSGQLADEFSQSREICESVDSPSCKLLVDLYQQHIRGGDVNAQIDAGWDQIAYFQCGDSRGRKEPGTGEIPYARIFRHISSRGFTGIVGMEHGNSQSGAAGDQAVIDAYLRVDQC